MVKKKCLVFGMAMALLLTSNTMVSEAEGPGEGAAVGAEAETDAFFGEAETDSFAAESEALEAEARRQMMEAMEREEEARRQKEAQMAAEAERQMTEAVRSGESEPEVGSADAQAEGISWIVDGDTMVISGEGYVPEGNTLHDAMAAVKKVRFEECKILGSMDGFFEDLENLESIDLKGLDTSRVTDMGSMFAGCSGLTSLDVSNFNTSKVKYMGHYAEGHDQANGMFSGCSSLVSLDLNSFDTASVVDMGYMFSGCSSLTSLDLSGFNTRCVKNMESMFHGCESMTDLDVSGFDTSNVIVMNGMFKDCRSLAYLDLSNFNTSKVRYMGYYDEEHDQDNGMFSGCSSLASLDLSSFDTAAVVDMSYMFSGCSSLASLDVSSFDTSQVVGNADIEFIIDVYGTVYGMENIFLNCDQLMIIKAFKVPPLPMNAICILPETFADESGSRTTQITAEFAGKILTRVSQDSPSPDPGPGQEESDQVRSFVSRMYTVALGRTAEEAGLNDWTNRLLNHEVDGAGIAGGFIMSDEFKNKNVSDGDYVDILYRTFFDREADQGGRDTWTEALANGKSRDYVLAGFVNSEEFDSLCGRYGIIRGTMVIDMAVTLENIMDVLERYDPDGAFIIQYAVECESNVLYWWGESGSLTYGMHPAVHEECHSYSHFNSIGLYGDAIYTGNETCIQVPYTEVYQSMEMAVTIPEQLRTFRYDTYISVDSGNASANVLGAYGMLNEFTAYCWGMNNTVSLYPYYKSLGADLNAWDEFITYGANGRLAFTEFKYYILMYLAYAEENYPEVYVGIINNKEFRDAYFAVETKYAGLIADFEGKLQEAAEYLTQNGYPAWIEGDSFRIQTWTHPSGSASSSVGYGIYTSDYEKLMKEINGPICQRVYKAMMQASNRADVTGSREFVTRLYQVCLGRTPDEAGLRDWTEKLVNGTLTGQAVAEGFIMSDEFQNKGLGNSEYVDAMYAAFFGREADAEGKKSWVDQLDAGTSRRYVMAGFANSVEFDGLCYSYGIIRGTMDVSGEKVVRPGVRSFVERCYIKVLGREGEKSGVDDWVDWIARGEQTPESAAKLFFFSEEYQNMHTNDEEFVETLYQTFMDRASDPAGKADWLRHLAGGMSREEVLEGFSRSVEFAGIMESFGL